jgi:hypothetical protein
MMVDDTYERDELREWQKYEKPDEPQLWERKWLESYQLWLFFELAGVRA